MSNQGWTNGDTVLSLVAPASLYPPVVPGAVSQGCGVVHEKEFTSDHENLIPGFFNVTTPSTTKEGFKDMTSITTTGKFKVTNPTPTTGKFKVTTLTATSGKFEVSTPTPIPGKFNPGSDSDFRKI